MAGTMRATRTRPGSGPANWLVRALAALVLALPVVTAASSATAQQQPVRNVALARNVTGQVEASEQGGPFQALAGTRSLVDGDALSTGPDGTALLSLPDGTSVLLAPRTRVLLQSIAPSATVVSFSAGVVGVTVPQAALDAGSFQFLGPTANIRARQALRFIASARDVDPIPAPPPAPPEPAAAPTNFCPPGQQPTFVLGFRYLEDLLGEPIMGLPIECEHANPENGDALQLTTAGLSFYRKSTNTPTFTDGYEHWAYTAEGLVHWYGDAIDPPADAEPVPPPAGAVAGLTVLAPDGPQTGLELRAASAGASALRQDTTGDALTQATLLPNEDGSVGRALFEPTNQSHLPIILDQVGETASASQNTVLNPSWDLATVQQLLALTNNLDPDGPGMGAHLFNAGWHSLDGLLNALLGNGSFTGPALPPLASPTPTAIPVATRAATPTPEPTPEPPASSSGGGGGGGGSSSGGGGDSGGGGGSSGGGGSYYYYGFGMNSTLAMSLAGGSADASFVVTILGALIGGLSLVSRFRSWRGR